MVAAPYTVPADCSRMGWAAAPGSSSNEKLSTRLPLLAVTVF